MSQRNKEEKKEHNQGKSNKETQYNNSNSTKQNDTKKKEIGEYIEFEDIKDQK